MLRFTRQCAQMPAVRQWLKMTKRSALLKRGPLGPCVSGCLFSVLGWGFDKGREHQFGSPASDALEVFWFQLSQFF